MYAFVLNNFIVFVIIRIIILIVRFTFERLLIMNIKIEMDSNNIITEIFKEHNFTETEKDFILPKFKKVELKKGAIILQENEVVRDQYFVLDGCLRTYFIDVSGKEFTLQFAINDWWISDYTAFFSTTKAILNIECIKAATLYKISRENMEDLYKSFPRLEHLFRKKLENAFASFQKRILSNLAQSAQERYLSFIETYPNIEQHIKNYHIASYLGITTESLSRIRKKMASK